MALHERYEIAETAGYILRRGFSRVALQFPDELLKESVLVLAALQEEIVEQFGSQSNRSSTDSRHGTSSVEETPPSVQFFVMADTTYGSCCVDEVAAAHVDAQSIIHYGHACLSQTSRLPVLFVFGKADIDLESCARKLMELAFKSQQPLLVLYGLEYAHGVRTIEARINDNNLTFAKLAFKEMEPTTSLLLSSSNMVASTVLEASSKSNCDRCAKTQFSREEALKAGAFETTSGCCKNHCMQFSREDVEGQGNMGYLASKVDNDMYLIGGLKWKILSSQKMEDFLIVWIGQETSALTNFMLVHNTCTVVRYDPTNQVQVYLANQSKALRRRYYFVERAKDANIVGIVVGTLGVAGYKEVIQHLRDMVKKAGKKSYTLLMGKPNPSKLANFPECDVFVLVACPETALLDSKEYLAPLITPFEAKLAFIRGQQWSGAYTFDFRRLSLVTNHENGEASVEGSDTNMDDEDLHFSFLKGGYVEMGTSTKDPVPQPSSTGIVPARVERALEKNTNGIYSSGKTKNYNSSSEYFLDRSFRGLELSDSNDKLLVLDNEFKNTVPSYQALVGRKGRASGYNDEKIYTETS